MKTVAVDVDWRVSSEGNLHRLYGGQMLLGQVFVSEGEVVAVHGAPAMDWEGRPLEEIKAVLEVTIVSSLRARQEDSAK